MSVEPEHGQVWKDADGRLYEVEGDAKHMGTRRGLVLYRERGGPEWPVMAVPMGGEWDERFTFVSGSS